MRFYGKISGKYQEALYNEEKDAFLVTGACGHKMYISPEQLATVVDWEKNIEISAAEQDIFLWTVK